MFACLQDPRKEVIPSRGCSGDAPGDDTVTGATADPDAVRRARESQCPPCAQKNRRLRMQQCREGWHLDAEPERENVAQVDDAEDGSVVAADLSTRRKRAPNRQSVVGCDVRSKAALARRLRRSSSSCAAGPTRCPDDTGAISRERRS